MFFLEFRNTASAARDPDTGEILGYLLGFIAPSGDGYIHFVACGAIPGRWVWAGGCMRPSRKRPVNAKRAR